MEEFKKMICDLLDSVSEKHRNTEEKFVQLEASLTKRITEVEENYEVLKKRFELIVEENKVLKVLNEDLTQRINDLYDVYADRNMEGENDFDEENRYFPEQDSEEEPGDEDSFGEKPVYEDLSSEGLVPDVIAENPAADLERQQEEGAEVYRLVQEMDEEQNDGDKEVEDEMAKMDQRLFSEDENPDAYAYSLFDAKFQQPQEDEQSNEDEQPQVEEQAEDPESEAVEGNKVPGEPEDIELSLFDTLIKNDAGEHPLWITDNPGPAVSKITHGITINDKIMYINSLFNGDSVLYKRTMSLLEDFPTFGEAYTFLREQFPEWDEGSKEVYSFYMTVRRKLRS